MAARRLSDFRKRLQSAAKGTHIEVLSESKIATDRKFFPTPAYDLNRILSGSFYKGLPTRNFALMVGPEASFKSSFMCLCAVEAQKQGYTPLVIDTEGAWTADFVSRWGLDPEEILYVYTPWIDKVMVTLGDIIENGDEKLCIILDSIGGLEKYKLVKDSAEGTPKADQGTLQKEIKRLLKMILNICKGNDSIAMAAGHYYGNPSGYGDAEKIGGGFFAKLAPDTIVSLKKSKIFDNPKAKDRKVIGTNIKAITMKNRVYPPFQEATVQIDYLNGVNKMAGLMDIALQCGLVSVGGAWFTMPDGSKVQGRIKAEEWAQENEAEFMKPLEEIIEKTGYSTINEEIKAVEEEKLEDPKPTKRKK